MAKPLMGLDGKAPLTCDLGNDALQGGLANDNPDGETDDDVTGNGRSDTLFGSNGVSFLP